MTPMVSPGNSPPIFIEDYMPKIGQQPIKVGIVNIQQCRACEGRGVSSKGGKCLPCGGTGVTKYPIWDGKEYARARSRER